MLIFITVGLQIQPSRGNPLRRICNPTASSISICNALINNQKTQNIFTHLKCLYSLRLDCKSNRARNIRCTPLRRICNPTASSISICNALINKQETKNIFTHLKCLYSLRLDYKSNRARNIQPSKGHPLRRICNPTASSISICNALINNQKTKNIFTHLKCLYSLRLDCKSNRAREIQPSKGLPLRRICNPTASSISICNALINNQETKNIFTHLKCLYSLRLDCKSNRAREIQPSKVHPFL